nr:hypothetical protein [Paraburkholderia caballeronis]
MRVRGLLVGWNRSHARCLRDDCAAFADGSSGRLASRLYPSSSASAVLSRRFVRRRNALFARAFIAIHADGVASLLP